MVLLSEANTTVLFSKQQAWANNSMTKKLWNAIGTMEETSRWKRNSKQRKMKSNVIAQHEAVNGRLKQFNVLTTHLWHMKPNREGIMEKHKWCFAAVTVITQLKFWSDVDLWRWCWIWCGVFLVQRLVHCVGGRSFGLSITEAELVRR